MRIISFFQGILQPKRPIENRHLQNILERVKNGQITTPEAIIKAMTMDSSTRNLVDFAVKEITLNPLLKNKENFVQFLERLPYNRDATNYSKLAKQLRQRLFF